MEFIINECCLMESEQFCGNTCIVGFLKTG